MYTAPATFSVLFATPVGNFSVDVNRSAAPLGVDRFYSLVKCKYFDGCGFFRVVPGFVTQWGINGDPATSALWEKAVSRWATRPLVPPILQVLM